MNQGQGKHLISVFPLKIPEKKIGMEVKAKFYCFFFNFYLGYIVQGSDDSSYLRMTIQTLRLELKIEIGKG